MNIKNNKTTYISILLAATLLVGCGSSSSGSSKNSGTGDIDLANYLPNKDTSKTYYTSEGNETKAYPGVTTENIEVKTENNITTIINTDSDGDIEKTLISDKNITSQIDEKLNFSGYRHVNIGDTFFKIAETTNYEIPNYAKVSQIIDLECTIDEQLKTFSKGEHTYEGDILKVACIDNGKITVDINKALIEHIPTSVFKDINGTHDNYDTSYIYYKKDIGEIASIDDDCILNSTEPRIQDDRKQECVEKYHDYEYYIEPTK